MDHHHMAMGMGPIDATRDTNARLNIELPQDLSKLTTPARTFLEPHEMFTSDKNPHKAL